MPNEGFSAGGAEPRGVAREMRDMGDGTKAPTIAAVTLWPLGGATKITCASSSVAAVGVALPSHDGAISILASGGRCFFKLGDSSVVAAATDHCIDGARGERMEFLLKAGQTHISILNDTGVANARLDISGLGDPT